MVDLQASAKPRISGLAIIVAVCVACFALASCEEKSSSGQAITEAQRAVAESRAVSEARQELWKKIDEIDKLVELQRLNLAEWRLAHLHYSAETVERETAKREAEIDERLKRRNWLKRQLDYIEVYDRLPPDSFFASEDRGE